MSRFIRLSIFAGLTASEEGLETVYKNARIIFNSLADESFTNNSDIAEKIGSILINMSAEDRGVELFININISSNNIRDSRVSLLNNTP